MGGRLTSISCLKNRQRENGDILKLPTKSDINLIANGELQQPSNENYSSGTISESSHNTDLSSLKRINELSSFNSPIGVLLSCLGCVIGTGNIWRFPRIIATASSSQGCLTFILCWAVSLCIWSLPLSIVEYSLGRFTRSSPLGAFHKFFGTKLIWLGGWIVAVTYMITAYFSVIVGWCLYYLFKTCTLSKLPGDEESSLQIFNEFTKESYWPVVMHTVAVVIVGFCIFGGINWIEKANMVLVPMLLGIVIFTFGWSISRDYSEVGITFIFTPHWADIIDPSVWVSAATQNAFDTGAAMALFISYSSHFTRKNGSVRFGTIIPIINNSISMLCAITIFSTVFSSFIQTSPTLTRSAIVKIMKATGPGSTGLTFTWIPALFSNFGIIGRVLCSLFFLCLSFAGITSLIGHIQLTVVTAKDLGLNHRQATLAGLFLTFIFGLPSAFSIAVLTNQDTVWGYALMLSGLAMAMLVLIYGPLRYRKVVVNDFGINDWNLSIIWVFMISFLVPMSGVGLIIWWVYDAVTTDTYWYQITLTSVTTTLLEWLVVLIILLSVNGIVVYRNIKLFDHKNQMGYDPYNPDYTPKETVEFLQNEQLTEFDGSSPKLRLHNNTIIKRID